MLRKLVQAPVPESLEESQVNKKNTSVTGDPAWDGERAYRGFFQPSSQRVFVSVCNPTVSEPAIHVAQQ